jgi:cyanate permease
VPRAAALGFVCGLAGGAGAAALMAIIRDRERAVTVFAALVPLVVGVGFVLVELISGNP